MKVDNKAIKLIEKDTYDRGRTIHIVIGYGIDLHRVLGPGLLESAYKE